MKGNQRLEALAALCGGRPNAVDAPASTPGAANLPMVTMNANPTVQTTGMPPADTAAGAKDSSSEATTNAGASNYLYIQQANERGSESTNHTGATAQQHSSATPPPVTSVPNPMAAMNLTPQQISQAIFAAANSQGGRMDPVLAQSLLFSTALRGSAGGSDSVASSSAAGQVPSTNNNNALANTMQQLMIQQYLQAQSNVQQQQAQQQAQAQAAAAAAAIANGSHPHAALFAMNLAAGKGQHQHLLPNIAPAPSTTSTTTTGPTDGHRTNQNLAPSAQQQAQALLQQAAQQQAAQQQANQIQQSQAIHQQHYQYGGGGGGGGNANPSLPSMMKAAAAGGRILPSSVVSSNGENIGVGNQDVTKNAPDTEMQQGHKKQQKRAANRRSAQLSRKRKKQFIEELKEENDELRRKEQILQAIPDLIVVFDSSGRLGFVSESMGRFFDMPPVRLEGTSFWELICQDSVRLLKAAFMDALAAREADSDTAVLGSGVWELRLKKKDSQYMLVTLNGVVHFKGDAPECVCCIRPLGDEEQKQKQHQEQQGQLASSNQQVKGIGSVANDNGDGGAAAINKAMNRAVSCSDGDASRTSDGSNGTQQSVLNSRLVPAHAHGLSMSSSTQDEAANMKFRRVRASADDAGNSSSNNNDTNKNNDLEADGTNNSIRISDGDSSSGLSD